MAASIDHKVDNHPLRGIVNVTDPSTNTSKIPPVITKIPKCCKRTNHQVDP